MPELLAMVWVERDPLEVVRLDCPEWLPEDLLDEVREDLVLELPERPCDARAEVREEPRLLLWACSSPG